MTLPPHIHIANPNGNREFIMIVDDDALIRPLVEHVLTNEGYRVISACDGPHALDIYRRVYDQIQLVILDFNMPGMDGFVLFGELQLINPQVVAVLTSGMIQEDKLKGMMAKGLRGFMQKPLTQQKLLQNVRAILDAVQGEGRVAREPVRRQQ
jgi:DNA-binding response OmpR family regulator